jgi:hypothetical protein
MMLQTVTARMLALLLALCPAMGTCGVCNCGQGPEPTQPALDLPGTTEDRVAAGRGHAQAIIGLVTPE